MQFMPFYWHPKSDKTTFQGVKVLKRLKQIFILVSIFSLGGVGITYAASTNQIQNFFLGNAPLASNNLNQVLALLVGPKGPPGPAGARGWRR